MLSRGFLDPVAFWPIVAWPLIFSSCLYAILSVCRVWSGSDAGMSLLDARRLPDAAILYVFFPAALAFEIFVHGYMLWLLGFEYLAVFIAIYVFGWILLPWLFDGWRPAQYILPLAYICLAAAFMVLMGFADIGVLRALNSELYGLFTGLPAKL